MIVVVVVVSNRDGKNSKLNKKRKFSHPNTKCPNCKTRLEKCDQQGKGHDHHRHCPTCKYSNY